jgi:hypothetical protein
MQKPENLSVSYVIATVLKKLQCTLASLEITGLIKRKSYIVGS